MARAKFISVLLIIATASALIALLGQYWFRQQMLLLEGSHLYTSDAVLLKSDSSELLEQMKKLGDDARVFSELDAYENVRVVAANDITKLPFPVHDGTGFTNSRHREALVGSDIETEQRNGERYVTLGNEQYKVVGVLGTKNGGALQNEIVLKDNELFSAAPARSVVIDGSEAATRYREIEPGAVLEAFDYGVARRTTVDTVTPVLLGVGYLLAALSYLFAGWLYGSQYVPQYRVIHLLGFSRRLYIARRLAVVACLSVATFAAAQRLVVHAGTSLPLPILTPVIGLAALCLVLLATMTPLVLSRRGLHADA
ncbi:hypothetical protein [Actinobaculum sp. 352]|uniref:hypothetical protein n=1 Tax=Actinobaculum sp. 352 TaxID=2490946 RepID=UPI000F7E24D3|nr:hypothetical protein [Actinobaculum sp. 352]RTE48388.1 hypothetical protein EKN07_09860 [Actinobaculum sp. 352]